MLSLQMKDLVKEYSQVDHNVLVTSFTEGQSFGENAILNEEIGRTGTCVAAEDTYCALVEKETYIKIVKKIN